MRYTALADKPIHQKGFGNVARGASLPACTAGWDTVTPLANMEPNKAILMDNYFPQPGYIELRRGHLEWADTETADPVESIMPYQALQPADDKLFAATDTDIWDVTVGSAVSVQNTLTNGRWQYVGFANDGGNFLWLCNGADLSRYWDGTVWTDVVLSGDITDSSQVINAAVFKNMIWLCRVDDLGAYYLATDAVAGACTLFSLQGVFTKGGYLMAIGTWSLDGGNGPDDYIAFISSRGEVAIYTGTNPATDFALVGVYTMGPPIGRRCLTKVGADLVIICVDGVLPLSKALIADRAAIINSSITRNIQPTVNESARKWRLNFGWEFTPYPLGTAVFLNVPAQENIEQQQYVMNTVTGAWCRFKGWNANCFCVFQERLFFGGNDGFVYEADVGGNDNGLPIQAEVRSAFNYFDTRGQQKRWTMCRPLLITNGAVVPALGLNVDFGEGSIPVPPEVILSQGALWDVATWDIDLWPVERTFVIDWQTVAGIGYCASIVMTVNVNSLSAAVLQINGWDLLMEDGGFI